MIRRPPRSTLFPTRRSSDLVAGAEQYFRRAQLIGYSQVMAVGMVVVEPGCDGRTAGVGRSEEHTSELQSHVNLVCRLLLEKKTQTNRPGALAAEHLDPLNSR